jgi:hypothetical protein
VYYLPELFSSFTTSCHTLAITFHLEYLLWYYTSQDLDQLTDKFNVVLWIVFYGGVVKKIDLTAN